ncbi:MAG: hypothetical protein R8K22_03310 [Mariprofundaceae bacterium]
MLDVEKQKDNTLLFIAGILSFSAALLHITCTVGGADWYRFLGAGEEMATMAAQGSWIPTVVTLFVASILVVWACYAFSGAGILPRMPLLKPALFVISAIYIARGLLLLPLWLGWLDETEQSSVFWFWSSVICLIYGLFYAIGTYQIWKQVEQ